MNIKTGDMVKIRAGKDKGKEGKVLQVFPKLGRVVVEGVNLSVRHLAARGAQQGTQGQKIKFPGPLAVSNVALLSDGKMGRVGYKKVEKAGKQQKVRVLRSKGEAVEVA